MIFEAAHKGNPVQKAVARPSFSKNLHKGGLQNLAFCKVLQPNGCRTLHFARFCNRSVAEPCIMQGSATDRLQNLALCKVLQPIGCRTLHYAGFCNRSISESRDARTLQPVARRSLLDIQPPPWANFVDSVWALRLFQIGGTLGTETCVRLYIGPLWTSVSEDCHHTLWWHCRIALRSMGQVQGVMNNMG